MQPKAKVQVFTDFDGTLSLEDTGILLIDDRRSMGPEKRKELERQIMDGEITYREAILKMWDSVNMTWDQAWSDHLSKCSVDPGFPEFYDYCKEYDFPVTVITSGFDFLVNKVLREYLGPKADNIEIVANTGTVSDTKWKMQYIDETEYGNDKSRTLAKHRAQDTENSVFVFCGDGVSDISAARHADVLFAREGRDLQEYCRRNQIPHIPFNSFRDIHDVVVNIAEGKWVVEKDETTGASKINRIADDQK